MNASQLFDLTPTDDQQMTRDVLQRFAVEEIATNARAADEAAELPAGFLDKTVDLGLNYMPIPESMGGVGGTRSPMSNVMSTEDLATGDMAMAAAAMAPLSVINCVMDYGTEHQQQFVAETLLSDRFVAAALATVEPGIVFDLNNLQTTAVEQADGSFVVNGKKSMVPFGEDARVIIVFAKLVDKTGAEKGTQGFVINQNQDGLHFEREDYMGLRPLPQFSMILENKALPSTAILSGGFDAQSFKNLSTLAVTALAVGTCQSVLDYVVPYVNERIAFGEPISHRQAVAFMVADIATELEGLRLMLYRAASQAEQGIDCSRMAYLAYRQAIKYGMKIGSDGVQLLGGHGYTREHPVELWYRNLRSIASIQGMLLA